MSEQPAEAAEVGWRVIDADGNVLQEGVGVVLTMDNLADEYTGGSTSPAEQTGD